MNDAELAFMLTKFRAAVAYAREIAPEVLNNPDAASNGHDALPTPAQPARSETRALTNLQPESE